MKKVSFLFFLFVGVTIAQEKNFNKGFLDSIQSLKFFELYQYYLKNQKEYPVNAHAYANAYLEKAKKEKNTFFTAHGLVLVADLYKNDMMYLKYMDSIIELTRNFKGKEFPARGYLLKGDYFYRQKLFSNALNNYKLANQFAMQKTNPRIIYACNRSVGLLQSNVGLHNQAATLFRKCYKYAKKKNISTALEDLYFLSRELNELKLLDSAASSNRKGIKISLEKNKKDLYHSFVLNSGITNYHKKEYQIAIDSISKILPYMEETDKASKLIVSYFYLGKAYDKINKNNRSIDFLIKMDSTITASQEIVSTIEEGYEILKEHYQVQKNYKSNLFYSKQLSKLDSISSDIYTDSLKTIVSEYKTPKIVSRDDIRINDLYDYKLYYYVLIIATIVGTSLMIGLLVYLYKDRNQYKKSFYAVVAFNNKLSQETEPALKEEKDKKLKDLNISQDTVDTILKGITNFEKNNKYLNKKYSLSSLAKEINTNSTYLSKVINIYMGKNFSSYLHDLRIGYAIDRLRDDRQFRLYSIKGISEEVGFKSSESFSKAFHKKTGIYPSAFIKRLKNT